MPFRAIGTPIGKPAPDMIKSDYPKILFKSGRHILPDRLIAAEAVGKNQCMAPSTRYAHPISLQSLRHVVSRTCVVAVGLDQSGTTSGINPMNQKKTGSHIPWYRFQGSA